MVPSVAINGVTFITVTMMPLASPMSAPMAATSRMTSGIGTSPRPGKTLFTLSIDCSSVADTTAASPTCRPTDKSVPCVTISPATPSAMMTRTEDWVRMLLKLVRLRKLVSLETMTTSSISSTK